MMKSPGNLQTIWNIGSIVHRKLELIYTQETFSQIMVYINLLTYISPSGLMYSQLSFQQNSFWKMKNVGRVPLFCTTYSFVPVYGNFLCQHTMLPSFTIEFLCLVLSVDWCSNRMLRRKVLAIHKHLLQEINTDWSELI